MNGLIDVLQWAFPAGVSVVNIALMAAIWRKNRANLVKDTRDTWQSIAESNNEALIKQNNEIRNLREVVARLEIVLQKIIGCKYYDDCPARLLVQSYKDKYIRAASNRQSGLQKKTHRHARDNPVEPGGDGDPDRQPP